MRQILVQCWKKGRHQWFDGIDLNNSSRIFSTSGESSLLTLGQHRYLLRGAIHILNISSSPGLPVPGHHLRELLRAEDLSRAVPLRGVRGGGAGKVQSAERPDGF